MTQTISPSPPSFSLEDILLATGGQLLNHNVQFLPAPESCQGTLCTDTRQMGGENPITPVWYIPLVGERFDGHSFLPNVVQKNANTEILCGCLIQEDRIKNYPEAETWLCPIVAVGDTTLAYQQLAGWYVKNRCPNTVVVGITGSSGKTTAKEMLLSTLSPFFNTKATQKNFNNDIGVAQTLLSCTPETEVLIVEMGMRGLGEIERLSQIAQPHIAMVLNIGPAHIGRLGSMEAIAQAKSEIFTGLSAHATLAKPVAILPEDEPLLDTTRKRLQSDARLAVATFPSRFPPVTREITVDTIPLPVASAHMAANAMAVAAVGKALGLSATQIATGLEHYQPTESRGCAVAVPSSHPVSNMVVQDAYNANPASMLASLTSVLVSYPRHVPVLVLAGMKELGDFEAEYHTQLGEQLNRLLEQHPLGEQARVLLMGDEMAATKHALANRLNVLYLAQTDPPNDAVQTQWLKVVQQQLPETAPWVALFKGSRYYQLDTLGQRVLQAFQSTAAVGI